MSLDDAEKRMHALEGRLLSLESKSSVATSSSDIDKAVREYQGQLLGRLKSVRDSLIAEGGDIGRITKERDQAMEENKMMKKATENMTYRISHLIKSLNAEEEEVRILKEKLKKYES
jgi:hypothetical protein